MQFSDIEISVPPSEHSPVVSNKGSNNDGATFLFKVKLVQRPAPRLHHDAESSVRIAASFKLVRCFLLQLAS